MPLIFLGLGIAGLVGAAGFISGLAVGGNVGRLALLIGTGVVVSNLVKR